MYDAFISYASEDKEKFVRQLAQKLREKNISIWFDEFSLKVGDSLRKSIDKGLKESKYGIVVFSPYFFEKNWPVWELDGLIQLQNKYFAAYIESRKPLTPEQYRIAKEFYEVGFRDYRKFFNELNK